MNENRLQKGTEKGEANSNRMTDKICLFDWAMEEKEISILQRIGKGRETGENSGENRSGKMYAKKYNNRANEGKRERENERA